jgi:hypothetical protein
MATERDYRITVSALLARGSVSAAVNDFVSQMMAAKKKVDDILSQPSKGAKDAAAKEGKARVDEAKKAAAELDRIREKENDAILRDVAKTEATKGRIKERYSREERDRNEKTDQERAKRNEKIASDAMGFMRKAAGAAARVAGEVVGGLGVSFDVGSAVRRGMELDTVARRATISGKGALDQNATEADVQSTIATIRAAGVASKQDFGSLAKGLEDFVSKSSDLETGKKVLGDLGRIARATGTDVNELVSAAGDVNKTLEDGPDKADRLLEVMTLVATQSAKGAVEVKDFARYMGRITAGAFKFEGSRAQNIGILSSLAQIAMSGGAAGPREATNAAQAFSNDLTKGEALKRFDAAKIQLFTDDTKTTLRSPEKIITDYLRHSGGNLADLSKYFQNEGSRRVITGFAQKYNAAGGGEAGIKAVEAEFSKFAQTMSSDDVQKRFELSGGSREAKAAEFQNKFDTIVEGMMEKMLPALEKLEGPALKAADALTSLMVAATEHPWGTVAAVIGGSIAGSIAKAAIGDMIGKGIAGAMSAFGPAGFAVGLLAVAAAAAAAAIADYESKSDASKDKFDKDIPTLVAKAQKQLKETGTIDKDTIDEIARRRAEVEGVRQTVDKTTLGTDNLSYTQILAAKVTGGADQVADAEGSLTAGAQNKEGLDKQAAALDALLKAFADTKRRPTAEEIGTAVAKAIPQPPGGPAAPTGGQVAQ